MSMENRFFIITEIEPHGAEAVETLAEVQDFLDNEHYPEVEEAGGPRLLAKIVVKGGPSDADDTITYVQEIQGGIEGWDKYNNGKRPGLKAKFKAKLGERMQRGDFSMKQKASKGIVL